MIADLVASLRSTIPVIRPSCMTRTRSLMPSTSGISDEIIIIGDALPGELGDELVDLSLGADIDAARRFVEDENPRVGHKPAGYEHLLLVPARQIDDRLLEIGRAHPQTRLLRLAERLDLALLDESCARVPAPQERHLHIGENVEQEEASAFLAVFRQERNAGVHRHAGVLDRNLRAVDCDGSGGRRRHAKQGFCDIAAPGADQASETEDLALAKIEGDIVKPAFEGQIAHRKNDIANRNGLFRKHLGYLSPDHQSDDVVTRDVCRRMLTDETAVAKHRDIRRRSRTARSSYGLCR